MTFPEVVASAEAVLETKIEAAAILEHDPAPSFGGAVGMLIAGVLRLRRQREWFPAWGLVVVTHERVALFSVALTTIAAPLRA